MLGRPDSGGLNVFEVLLVRDLGDHQVVALDGDRVTGGLGIQGTYIALAFGSGADQSLNDLTVVADFGAPTLDGDHAWRGVLGTGADGRGGPGGKGQQ